MEVNQAVIDKMVEGEGEDTFGAQILLEHARVLCTRAVRIGFLQRVAMIQL